MTKVKGTREGHDQGFVPEVRVSTDFETQLRFLHQLDPVMAHAREIGCYMGP